MEFRLIKIIFVASLSTWLLQRNFEVVELFAGDFLLFEKTNFINESFRLTYSLIFHVESFVLNCNLLFFQSNLTMCMLQIYFSIAA